MRGVITGALYVAGVVCVVVGLAMVYVPLAWLAAGAFMVRLGWALESGGSA